MRKHLDAPLLNERIVFLLQMEEKGNSLRSLQITSNYLLFAVRVLHLKDDTKDVVSFERIQLAGREWKQMRLSSSRRKNTDESVDTKKRDFVCITVKWLSGIGRINPLYLNDELIFNRLNKEPSFRLNYYCAPYFEERLAYLNHLEANGMSFNSLREYAEYQLYIIEFLNLTFSCRFSSSEIKTAAVKWNAMGNNNMLKDSTKRLQYFRKVANGWFKYANLIISDKPNIEESEKLDAYCDWMFKDNYLLFYKNQNGIIIFLKGFCKLIYFFKAFAMLGFLFVVIH